MGQGPSRLLWPLEALGCLEGGWEAQQSKGASEARLMEASESFTQEPKASQRGSLLAPVTKQQSLLCQGAAAPAQVEGCLGGRGAAAAGRRAACSQRVRGMKHCQCLQGKSSAAQEEALIGLEGLSKDSGLPPPKALEGCSGRALSLAGASSSEWPPQLGVSFAAALVHGLA